LAANLSRAKEHIKEYKTESISRTTEMQGIQRSLKDARLAIEKFTPRAEQDKSNRINENSRSAANLSLAKVCSKEFERESIRCTT
jgi:hypothetical protein